MPKPKDLQIDICSTTHRCLDHHVVFSAAYSYAVTCVLMGDSIFMGHLQGPSGKCKYAMTAEPIGATCFEATDGRYRKCN